MKNIIVTILLALMFQFLAVNVKAETLDNKTDTELTNNAAKIMCAKLILGFVEDNSSLGNKVSNDSLEKSVAIMPIDSKRNLVIVAVSSVSPLKKFEDTQFTECNLRLSFVVGPKK